MTNEQNPAVSGLETPPEPVGEYADTCVRYVQTSIGIALDFSIETLPLLDHYLREARDAAHTTDGSTELLASVAGAYLGEVIRRSHQAVWLLDDDPLRWRLELYGGLMSAYPVAIAYIALVGPKAENSVSVFEFSREDAALVAEHLAGLPGVDPEEYLAPSTRLEVLDIAADLLRARHATGANGPSADHDEPPLLS